MILRNGEKYLGAIESEDSNLGMLIYYMISDSNSSNLIDLKTTFQPNTMVGII
jgi:hypothetical protein